MTPANDALRSLDDATRTALRERLERDRGELMAQLELAKGDLPAVTATTGQGETEHVSTDVENWIQAALDAGDAARLVEVNDALARFENGTYGRCERCASTIASARLEAIPHARLCMACQTAEDAERRPRFAR